MKEAKSFRAVLEGAIACNNDDFERIIEMYEPMLRRYSTWNGVLDEDLRQTILYRMAKKYRNLTCDRLQKWSRDFFHSGRVRFLRFQLYLEVEGIPVPCTLKTEYTSGTLPGQERLSLRRNAEP